MRGVNTGSLDVCFVSQWIRVSRQNLKNMICMVKPIKTGRKNTRLQLHSYTFLHRTNYEL